MRAIINYDIVSMYQAPSVKSELADEALFGMGVTMLPQDASHENGRAGINGGGEWVKIRTDYRYEGYVEKRRLVCDACLTTKWDSLAKKVALAPYADVLSAPNVKSPRLAGVPRGGIVALYNQDFSNFATDNTTSSHNNNSAATSVSAASSVSTVSSVSAVSSLSATSSISAASSVSASSDIIRNGWQRVFLPDGSDGYIKAGLLGQYITGWNPADEQKIRRSIVNSAMSYMGAQYRWGGKTPMGIDCSGLTAMAYLLNGIIIYRDAAIMPGYAIHKIPPESAKPGDLLFFPGHVAMSLGEGKYIHSTAKAGSDGVVINSMNPGDPEFRRDLLEAFESAGSIFNIEN